MENNKTANLKFLELCDEIDYWKDRALIAEKDAEDWRNKYSAQINESLKTAQKGVAQALIFALHSTNDENGNLVIKRKDREKISESYK